MAGLVGYLTSEDQAADFASLVDAVLFTELDSALQADGQLLFAPKKAEWDGLPDSALLWNKQLTTNLLLNHVINRTTALPNSAEDVASYAGNTLSASATSVAGIGALNRNAPSGIFVYDIDGFLLTTDIVPGITANTDDTLLDGALGQIPDSIEQYVSSGLQGILSKLNPASVCLTATPATTAFCSERGFTVFLPSGAAFDQLLTEVGIKNGVDEFLTDGGLDRVLTYHTVGDATPVESTTYASLGGKDIVVDLSQEKPVSIDGVGAEVDTTALNFVNGQAHIIDRVLAFPRNSTVEIASENAFTQTLVEQVAAQGLVDTLNDVKRSTIFAPTNAAFEPILAFASWDTATVTSEVLTDILTYHVTPARYYSTDIDSDLDAETLQGEKIDNIDMNVVEVADVLATNGNIHIINKVLIPPTLRGAVPTADIVGLAVAATPTLAGLVVAADLVATLSDLDETFTVFAPSDDAFAKVAKADIDFLSNEENVAILKDLLTYHVVSGSPILSSALGEKQEVTSVEGSKYEVTKDEGGNVVIGNSKVTDADNKAYNGVVHIVDELLIPQDILVQLPSQQFGAASSLSISAAIMGVVSFLSAAF